MNKTASFIVLFPGKDGKAPSVRFDIGQTRVGAFCPKLTSDFLRANFTRKVKQETGNVFFQSKSELLVTHGDVRKGTKNPNQLFVSVTAIEALPPLSNADLDAAFAEPESTPKHEEPETPAEDTGDKPF